MKLIRESYTQKVVTFLANHLNKKLQEEAATQPELVDVLAVRTTRSWDDPRFPLSDCPILKCYKINDSYKFGTLFRNSNARIVYIVSYPNLEVLPNLLDWVSYHINEGLLTFDMIEPNVLAFTNNQPYNANYLLTASEANQAIYPFLSFDISFKNYYDNCD
jgi:hypothetical protein